MTENERDEAAKLLTVNWFNDFEERLPISVRILISFSMELLLAVIVYSFHISNPNMILVTGLVASSALLGMYGGVTAAIVMLAYTFFLLFFQSRFCDIRSCQSAESNRLHHRHSRNYRYRLLSET